jgi:hypothetical protein
MELLVELGHATPTIDPDYYTSGGPWNILAEPAGGLAAFGFSKGR